MPMMSVVRAALPLLAVLFVFVIIVSYVCWISKVWPNTLMSPEFDRIIRAVYAGY